VLNQRLLTGAVTRLGRFILVTSTSGPRFQRYTTSSAAEQKAIPMLLAFRAGGWGMYFILAFGLCAVYAAARFFWRGDVAFARFSRAMMQTTGLAAVFGFLTGMIAVSNYIVAQAKTLDERVAILIEGTGEALNNLTLGLLLITLSALLVAIGQRRFPSAG
jgi:hypothetical protein